MTDQVWWYIRQLKVRRQSRWAKVREYLALALIGAALALAFVEAF